MIDRETKKSTGNYRVDGPIVLRSSNLDPHQQSMGVHLYRGVGRHRVPCVEPHLAPRGLSLIRIIPNSRSNSHQRGHALHARHPDHISHPVGRHRLADCSDHRRYADHGRPRDIPGTSSTRDLVSSAAGSTSSAESMLCLMI